MMRTRPYEHTVFTVPCLAGKGFFLFTNGADPEFLIEDVPTEYARLCADALNHMVERGRAGDAPETGHTVTFGACQFTLEQLHGAALNYARMCRVGALSRGAIVRLHLGIERRGPLHIDTRPLSTGALPGTPEACPVCHKNAGDETVWRNPQQSQIPTMCNHYLCFNCWEEAARHDQRCPLCRTDVSEWIRRHLFERDREAEEAERLADSMLSCISPNRLRRLLMSFGSAGTDEARLNAFLRLFQDGAQAADAAMPHEA